MIGEFNKIFPVIDCVRLLKNHSLSQGNFEPKDNKSHANYHATTKLKRRYKEITGKSSLNTDTEINTGVETESASTFQCSSKKQDNNNAKELLKQVFTMKISDKQLMLFL